MSSRRCFLRLAVATTALLALGPPGMAHGASPITGKLSKSGYTVVAIAKNGRAASVKARGTFKLRAPAKTVTLQLRDRRGKYAGPVVVGRKGRRAIVGVRAGARLGKVRVLKGYARPARRLSARLVDAKLTARSRRGVPVGVGKFGLVRSGAGAAQEPPPLGGQPPPGGAAPPAEGSGAGRDADSDGLPNAFDVDDDGDLVLDNTDPSGGGSTGFPNFAQLFLEMQDTVNASAAAISDAQIDRTVADKLELVFLNVPSDTELNCGGLLYCSPGGTGRLSSPPEEGGVGDPFPRCCDTDSDGMGAMPLNARGEFRLKPNAPSTKIGSGDTLIQRRSDGTEAPGTINFVFNTVPALNSWSDGAGNSGTVSYPAAAGPGTSQNPIPIKASPAGDYAITLRFWRPQRNPVPGSGEGKDYIDIGQLSYEANVPQFPGTPPGSAEAPQCPASSLSTSDPNLTVGSSGPGGHLIDRSQDRPANPANTLTFTVNITQCAVARGKTVTPGAPINMDIAAVSRNPSSVDHANQIIFVRPQ